MKHTLVMLLVLVLLGCVTNSSGPLLSVAEATRIGDLKARSAGYDLNQYHRPPLISYDARDDSWWVNYRRKNARYTEFSIQIEDKTKKAWVVVP
jgi:hypothetical protein